MNGVRSVRLLSVGKLAFLFLLLITGTLQAQWVQMNGPYGANVNALFRHGSKIFAATDGGLFLADTADGEWKACPNVPSSATAIAGNDSVLCVIDLGRFYRSTDGGTSWQMDSLFSWYARGLAAEHNLFLLCARDTLYLSADDSFTWKKINPPAPDINDLMIRNGELFVWANGLYRSTDSGASWNLMLNDSISVHAYGLVSNERSIFVLSYLNVLRSDDDGIHWITLPSINSGWITSLAADGDTLFAGTPGYGIYGSTDNGNTWRQCSEFPARGAAFLFTPGAIFAGDYGRGVYRSRDGGSTWTIWNDKLNVAGTGLVAGSSSANMYVDSEGDLFRSTDGGQTWTMPAESTVTAAKQHTVPNRTRTLPAPGASLVRREYWRMQMQHDAQSASDFSGADAPKYYSVDGETRQRIGRAKKETGFLQANAPNQFTVEDMAMDQETLYVHTGNAFYRSTDNGMNFNLIWQSDIHVPGVIGIGPDVIFVAGLDSLIRSTDHGRTWKAFVFDTADTYIFYHIYPFGGGLVFAAAYPEGGPGISLVSATLFKSTDNGETWKASTLRNVNQIAFARSAGVYFAGTEQGLFISPGSGMIWKTPYYFTDNYVIQSVVAAWNDVFVSTGNYENIFMSTNTGATFSAFDEGYTGMFAGKLFSLDSLLLLTTDFNGVWKRDMRNVLSVREGKNAEKLPGYSLANNYPNPFNPLTRIRYELTVQSQVHLTLYNILGQVVANLAQGVQDAGAKSVEWNAAGMPSGVYFYRLDATSVSDPSKRFTQTRKMVLIK
jgi:photosystem II stability/assembly factor-like uncharacterized protein